jgi:hypothetical protein
MRESACIERARIGNPIRSPHRCDEMQPPGHEETRLPMQDLRLKSLFPSLGRRVGTRYDELVLNDFTIENLIFC